MDGMDEWRFVADPGYDADEVRLEQQRKVERKNTYCNIIRDYEKLREIAAKIINALEIKDEEADEITAHCITALYVDNSYTTIDIEWMQIFDGRRHTGYVETVPAEWFALDENDLRGVVKSYKKQIQELVEGLKRDLDTAIEAKVAADKRVAEIKKQLSDLEGY